MKKYILSILSVSMITMAGMAQTINFEENNHKAISTYDYWVDSPFRTGELAGQVEIIDNPSPEEGVNETAKVLAFNRSRYGSHLYGARIDLQTPIQLSSTQSYIHVLVKTPKKGSLALIGLGKRNDWPAQSAEVFQLVRVSTKEIPAGKWADAVFKIYGNAAAQLHSLVIVPDTKSMLPTDDDYVVYFDEIIHNSDAQPRFSTEVYPLSFDKEQKNIRESERKLNGLTFTGNKGANLTFDLSSYKTAYIDKIDAEPLEVLVGEQITAQFNYKGDWMHRYVYLDKGNDGKFTPEISGNRPTANSDLVAYSFLGENEDNGYNSNGVSASKDTHADPPAFTIPADMEPGFYRIRCKVDWNSDDAGGNTASGNLIINNGGAIVDLLANIHMENVNLSVTARMCDVTAADGGQLPAQIPFGQAFSFNVEMDGDYEITGLEIKHGYNFTGEQYVCENRQWQVEKIALSEDGLITIPAEYVDGNVSIEIKFTNKNPTGLSSQQADGLNVLPGKGNLTLKSNSALEYCIVNASGIVMDKSVLSGERVIGLPSGVYIVNGQKYLVR